MKNNKLFWSFLVFLCMVSGLSAQTIPGDSIVHGPMLSPVYNNSVRVWVLTKNGTGSGSQLSITLTGAASPGTALTGTVHNQDDRLGYSLRSYEYTGLTQGETYTANVLVNGQPSGNTATVVNGNETIDDFQFLSGGCGRIYDLSRCMDIPESAFHVNGDPDIYNVMAREQSDLMVWLGDAVYLLGLEHAMGQCLDGQNDWANKDMAFDRYLFYRNYHRNLIKAMPQLAITDNHDTGPNEFNKTMPTLGEMREIFKDWWPNPEYKSTPEGPGLFSSYVYKDVEYFLTDNRSYRDGTQAHYGPDQMAWLKQALLNSTAPFKVLINGTPSFERNCGGRNFCSTTQSAELIAYIKEHNINGVLSLSADIHEQKFMIREGDVKYPLYDVLSGNLNSDIGNGVVNVNYNSDYVLTGMKQTYLRIGVYGDVGDRRMKVEYVGLNGQPYFEEIIHQDMLTSQNADALKLALGIDNSLTDASGFNHSFTTTGVTFGADRNGVANGAAQFTAATDVHTAAVNALNFHDRPFSLVAWVNPSQIPANGAVILSNGTATAGMSTGIDANGKLTFTNHATGTVLTSNYSILPNAWSHVAWKYDNVRRKLSLYFNGFLIQSWNNVVSPTASDANVSIGNNFQNKKFIGALDKFMLYGRIISDEEIMLDAEIESTRGGVLKVSGGQNMALSGTATNDALSNDFTIEFWGKLNGDPGTNYKIFASNGRVNNNSTGLSFEFPDSNKLNVIVGNNSAGWNNIFVEQGAAWTVGEWNHVALTATKNGTMKYYINGALIAEAPFTEYVANSWGLGFGKSPAYSGDINADLDEVRIWKRALTQQEIAQHMHYTLAGTETDLANYFNFNSEEGTTILDDLGAANADVTIAGGLLAPATSPVSVIAEEYRDVVTGKWSRNNTVNNAGLTLPDAITNYSSNVVIGKNNATELAVVPGHTDVFYSVGGWHIDPVNNPFATVRINLEQALTQFDSIRATAGHYFLLKQDSETEFATVAEGSFDGQNVTFYNANLAEGNYFIAWSAGEFIAGRGGALSLNTGHNVTIPYADLNPVLGGSFTMETWVNFTQSPRNTPLVSNHGRVNNNTTGFTVEILDNSTVQLTFGTGTPDWIRINSGAVSLATGEWNHVAITAVPGQNIKLYINGELTATGAYTAFAPNTNWAFALGKSLNYNSQSYSIMDEFRFWNKAKTQQEIKDQMHTIVSAADTNLVYNFTFDQEDNGTLVSNGTNTNAVTYTSAVIVDATSPVAEIITPFDDKVTGNWTKANERTNGLYLRDAVTSYVQNVVISRDYNNTLTDLLNAEDTKYVAGGWHVNAMGIQTGNLQVNLAEVFANPAQTNALAEQYMLIKGDPAGSYAVVATGTVTDLLVDFNDVELSFGNYYLAFTTNTAEVIAQQGGALHLEAGHDVRIPKAGVNTALSGSFTIELWARLTATAGANTKLVGFSNFGGGEFGWEMEFLGNQTLQTITGRGSAGGWNSLGSAHTWSHDEWNHVAVTFVPNGEFKFYVNGELASSMPVGTFQPCINDLTFGKNIANNSPTQSDIDEFRIWTVAKTQAEIRANMYLTMPTATDNLPYNYTFSQEDSGYMVNTGSVAVEVPYTNAEIIPATDPVRDIEAAYRNKVSASWSVMNDNRNGMYLNDVISSHDVNVVVGKETGNEILALPNIENATKKYLNSRWKFESLYVENGTPKVSLADVFDNLNSVDVLANEYYLLQGDPQGTYTVIATGTKQNNIVTFSQITFNNEPVYLAWLSDTTYPVGTFPVAAQSLWKYSDLGTDLGTDWKNNNFNDSTWMFGNGILGYGDPNQNTTLSYGPDAQHKYTTTYLRHTFNVENAAQYGSLLFETLRDDGVVVYVNGVEAFRSNMPEGDIAYTTFASSAISGAAETTYVENITANLLQDGVNVIAVELHQSDLTSSDLAFDMNVRALPPELEAANYPVAKDSEWHYLDNGTSLDDVEWGVATYSPGWLSGRAPLGYGDPVNTTISYGADASNKYITSYFYRNINVDLADVSDFVEFGLKRDDAAVIYINGVEAFRDNMPAGDFDYLTRSATTVDGADENRYFVHSVPKSMFQDGINRVAVEVHNRDNTSSDLKFDMYIKNAEDLTVACDAPHIACFTSIAPTGQTPNLIIAPEHRFQLLFKEGSNYTIGSGTVPGNHDFTAYVPIDGSSQTGHLSVNHENAPGGVSMLNIHLDTDNTLWAVDQSQQVDLYNDRLVTTTRNCSGGITPWGTVVTAEENTAAGDSNGDGYQDEGWLVEIDPATARVRDDYGNGFQEKLWAMGRMNHENVVVKADGTAAYYGEDGNTHCVYKFVPTTAGSLYSGAVYVLKLDLELSSDEPSSSTATWVQVPNTTQADRNNLNIVAASLGGTNFNGVEDCDISPLDGKIYFTSKGKNRIYRFKDDGSTVSEFEVFVGGMTYPIETANGVVNEAWADGNDNLTFDDKGNLWVCQDGGQNYIWVIRPDHKQDSPNVKLFASMPAGAEPTGLTFTPDYKYGFFSVQHPNGNNAPQTDATRGQVNFNASAALVFSLQRDLGLQAPVADFVASDVVVDENETVTFTDLSTHNPTSWSWTFEGGVPPTSTEEHPVVTYPTAGVYDVTLTTTNEAGSSLPVLKAEYILVEEVLGTENPLKALGVNVYPNPTKGLVNIEFNANMAGEKISVEVYDLMGRKVTERSNMSTIGGSQKIQLDLSNYAGEQVFIVKLKIGENTGSYKLLKVK
ncbi:LamG-like jellyroll fold domain-containing protein [Flavobacterium rivuli]|uniref:LamG-like jellyroll fold domain-containing protein n=1 Tax=Flavobacterium rivuli TaxID=498301 RepID=UPI0003814123|nr:LamG-like jellyroll fold domain-containing protein [Flavobacterium rivuli]